MVTWLTLLAATVLGFLTGLGTGGGSLLILWLTLILGMPQGEARIINLLFFIPSAVVSCFLHHRQGRLPIEKLLPAMIAGSVSTGLVTYLARFLDTALLRRGFGILLLVIGTRELFYRPRKDR